MKKGFTLAELLITIGIIGIVSALLGVAVSNLKPDSMKSKYLNRYDALSSAVKSMAANTALYPICANKDPKDSTSDNYNCKDYPLFSLNTGIGRNMIAGNGNQKFCKALNSIFNGNNNGGTVCDDNLKYLGDGKIFEPSFITPNGTDWLVLTTREIISPEVNGNNAKYQTEIYVDINGDDLPNCIYDADNCTQPDRFKFLVDARGGIYAADGLGQAYINTRHNYFKRNLVIPDVAATLPDNILNFKLEDCSSLAGNE